MSATTFRVPGTPVGKGRVRFVRKTGRTFTPTKTARFEERVAFFAEAAGLPLLSGPVELSVVARDGEDDSEELRSQPIEVLNAPPVIVSQPGEFAPDGTYRYQLVVEDSDGDRSFRYQLLAGPPGMQFDAADGQVRWTPRQDQAGSHPVKLSVTDRAGGNVTQTFQLDLAFQPAASPAY